MTTMSCRTEEQASWYADWQLDLSELPAVLGACPVRSQLALTRYDFASSADMREYVANDGTARCGQVAQRVSAQAANMIDEVQARDQRPPTGRAES